MAKTITARSKNSVAKDTPAAFVKLLAAGIKHIAEAAQMLKRMVGEDKGVIDRIREEDPSISSTLLSKLLLVADGHLMPELLISRAPAHKQLQTFPIEVQKAAMGRASVEVLVDPKRGEVREMKLAALKPHHVPQVFSRSGVRDVPAQREYLKNVTPKTPLLEMGAPWVIQGKKCIITRPCALVEKEIVKMLTAIRAV